MNERGYKFISGHWLVDDCYANEMSNEKCGSSIYSIVYFRICLANKISRKNGFALNHQNGMWNASQSIGYQSREELGQNI
jgi:hypothetical protein